jgi:uncharacterized protein
MLYLDASALVKRYITEDGSDALLAAMDEDGAVSMCRVGFVETKRAVARAGDRADVERFEADWQAFEVVEADQALCERAAELAQATGLRSLDAIHLAAALTLPSGGLVVATWDARLHRAARDHGLATLPASLD